MSTPERWTYLPAAIEANAIMFQSYVNKPEAMFQKTVNSRQNLSQK